MTARRDPGTGTESRAPDPSAESRAPDADRRSPDADRRNPDAGPARRSPNADPNADADADRRNPDAPRRAPHPWAWIRTGSG
ncbi:hypothetical protein GCM10009863_17860 [Streptomyces axinellae]|uniref:Uncharacterized protein n=1 Tax=Streptomyces axinellae TaxID=552788 RepID=A0ABP6C6G5_9ACTN